MDRAGFFAALSEPLKACHQERLEQFVRRRLEGEPLAYTDTGQLGLYLLEILQAGELTQAQHFAVNLFATGESDIAPVPEAELRLGGGLVAAEAGEQLGLQEFWKWLAAAADNGW